MRTQRSGEDRAHAFERALEIFLANMRATHDEDAASSGRVVTQALAELRQWAAGRRGVDREQAPRLHALLVEAVGAIHSALPVSETSAERAELRDLHGLLHALQVRFLLASRLYSYRAAEGRSLQEVATAVGLAQPYLGAIERCQVGLPSLEAGALLYELIGGGPVPVPAMADYEEGMATPDPERKAATAHLRRLVRELPTEDIRIVADLAAALLRRQPSSAPPTVTPADLALWREREAKRERPRR